MAGKLSACPTSSKGSTAGIRRRDAAHLLTCHPSVISKCQLSSVMLMEDDKRQSEKERERQMDRLTEGRGTDCE